MKNPERLVWIVLAGAAFFIGGRVHSGDGSGGAEGSAARSGKLASRAEGTGALRDGDPNDTPEHRAVMVERQALSSPLRTGRFMGMMAAMDQVKPNTWQAMWEEIKRQTTEDGRVHELEWNLFMNRVGEVDGAAAMAFFEKNGQPEYTFNRATILRGWAAASPEAAIQWMDSQPEDSPNRQLRQTLIEGVVQANPDLALSLLAKAPDQEGRQMAENFAGELIQAKGIQWTMDRVATELKAAGDRPPGYLEMLENGVSERVSRMSWLAGNKDAVTGWTSRRVHDTAEAIGEH